MKILRYFIVICLFCGCFACKIDWSERLKCANQLANEYFDSGSEEHFNDAVRMYDEIAKHSSEYRSEALFSKSIFLGSVYRFDEAISTAMQIPDTAVVFSSFITKSIHLNAILSSKAFHNDDFDGYEAYLKRINEELDARLTLRSDSLCHAICSGYVKNEDITALIYYLSNMSIYDEDKVDDVIKSWEDKIPEHNNHSKEFFNYLNDSFQ